MVLFIVCPLIGCAYMYMAIFKHMRTLRSSRVQRNNVASRNEANIARQFVFIIASFLA